MRNFIFILFSFFVAIMCTGCPYWCEPGGEIATLPDVSFTISPEKNTYAVNEEMTLTFSQIPDFSFFGRYSFVIKLGKFDENKKEYIATDKLKISDSESDSIVFEYEEKDVENSSKVVKTFPIKAVEEGKFACYISGNGYHFYNNGGCTLVGYDKSIYIDVVE